MSGALLSVSCLAIGGVVTFAVGVASQWLFNRPRYSGRVHRAKE